MSKSYEIELCLKNPETVDTFIELMKILDSIEKDFPWNIELSEAKIKLSYIMSDIGFKNA